METSPTSLLTSSYPFIGEDQFTAMTAPPAGGDNSFDFRLLFRCVIIIMGIVGIIANGLVLGALTASRQLKKELFNVLFVNQMSFDLYSSAMIVVTFFLKIFPVRLSGTFGYWLCALFYGETILWIGLNGSMLNLAAVAVERHIKIVHSAWYKKRCRPWMVYSVTRMFSASELAERARFVTFVAVEVVELIHNTDRLVFFPRAVQWRG